MKLLGEILKDAWMPADRREPWRWCEDIAAVQSSKTTSPELTLCYIIANLPGPCLWLDQTDEDAKDESESRLQKLFESCEPVKKLFPEEQE